MFFVKRVSNRNLKKGQSVSPEAAKPKRTSVVDFVSLQRRQSIVELENELNEETVDGTLQPPICPSRKYMDVETWREVIYWTLDDPQSSKVAQIISVFVMCVIVFSCICFCLESMPQYQKVPDSCLDFLNTTHCEIAIARGQQLLGCFNCPPVSQQFFLDAETSCIIIFSVEYLLRILCVHVLQAHDIRGELFPTEMQPGTVRKMWMFWKDTMNLIDFFAILP